MWKAINIKEHFDKLDDIKWKMLYLEEHAIEKMKMEMHRLGQ